MADGVGIGWIQPGLERDRRGGSAYATAIVVAGLARRLVETRGRSGGVLCFVLFDFAKSPDHQIAKFAMRNKPQPTMSHPLRSVALVGSYLPRRCGIGTFTNDLNDALLMADPDIAASTVAMNDRPEGYSYADKVRFEINDKRLAEYRLAADFLNVSGVDVCCVQHEFGIYGGKQGSYILEFINRLRLPVVATLHTVLKSPDEHQLDVTRQLADKCDRLVVMADRAYGFLRDLYGIEDDKITLIHHGIPDVPFVDPNFYKEQFGVEGKRVILTFGLLSPNKGIENMVEAMPQIIQHHPDAVYIVLGATHPGVTAESGEEYRLGLQRRAKELGVDKHIEWVNKFVELEELVEWLGAADVYVTPYLNEQQITSGTLAYALGTGKATVSTAYWYAQEMLADGRGVLVDMPPESGDRGGMVADLAEAILYLFDHEVERHAMRKKAYTFTRQMRWAEVGRQYLDLFRTVVQERLHNPKPAMERIDISDYAGGPELPEIKFDHVVTLTDDTGIFASSEHAVPDRDAGYTTDDNARALIASLLAQDHMTMTRVQTVDLDRLIIRYLSFLNHAFDDGSGRFRNHLSFDRVWADEAASEDTHGRALWALGEVVARSQVRGHIMHAAALFGRALPHCESFEHPLGWAFGLIGIHAYLRRFAGDSNARRTREHLADRLFQRFQERATDDWRWPMEAITYKAARIPHALLLAGRWMFRNEMIEKALWCLDWLHDVQLDQTGASGPGGGGAEVVGAHFSPVGTDGFYPRGGEKARFNQMPAEASASIDAYLEAYRITQDRKWLTRAHTCFNWFLGDNDLRVPLYDPATGGCSDCLQAHGVCEDQSAEATVAWLLSLLSLYEHSLDQATSTRPEDRITTPTRGIVAPSTATAAAATPTPATVTGDGDGRAA